MTARELAAEWIGFAGAMGILAGAMGVAFGWIDFQASTGALQVLIGATLICLSSAVLQVLQRAEARDARTSKPDPARCRWKECFAPECETHCPKAMAARFTAQRTNPEPRKRASSR